MSKKNRFNKPTPKSEKVVSAPSYDIPQGPVRTHSSKKIKTFAGIIAALAVACGIAYVLTSKSQSTPVAPRPELAQAEQVKAELTEELVAVEETVAEDIVASESFLDEELTEADKEILRNN